MAPASPAIIARENRLCPELLAGLQPQSMLLADWGHDSDWIRALVSQQGMGKHSAAVRIWLRADEFTP
jgi:hypothetical protein